MHDHPIAQHHAPRRSLQKSKLMGRNHQRRAGLSRLGHQINERIPSAGIEPDKRFVDEEQLKRTHETNGQRRLLPQPATKGGRKIVGPALQVQAIEEFPGPVLPIIETMKPGDVLKVLDHAEIVVQHRIVGEIGRESTSFERTGLMRSDRHRARCRLEQPTQDAQQRAFSGAIVTDQGHHLTGRRSHRHTLQSDQIAEIFGYVGGLQHLHTLAPH